MLKSLGSCMNIDKRLYLRRIVGMELEFCKVFYFDISEFLGHGRNMLSFVAHNYMH